MKLNKLTPRLRAIADCVNTGDKVADIGTDHGLIPVYLAGRCVCEQIIATDINPGPLNAGINSAAEVNVSERIRFLLCDGLSGINRDEVDTVIIAGMGGETIVGILERDIWALDKKLILQPMSKSEVLRDWLVKRNAAIIEERLVRDSGRLYQFYIVSGRCDDEYSRAELYLGKIEKCRNSELLKEYAHTLIQKCNKSIEGLKKSQLYGDEKRLQDLLALREEIARLIGETDGV